MPGVLPFVEHLGWVATGVFVLSYFCRSPAALRSFQMAGAVLWIAYGAIIGATPVVVANVMVFTAAAWTIVRARRAIAREDSAASDTLGRDINREAPKPAAAQ